MTQVDKLNTLLSRVQENRTAPRAARVEVAPPKAVAAAPAAAPSQAKAPTRPAVQEQRERGSVTEERVNIPDRTRSVAARPVTTDIRSPSRESGQQQSPEPRRPGRDRTATPLELALEGELSRPPTQDETTTKHVASAARKGTEPSMSAARPAITPSSTEPSFSVEPEPLREPNRPIAQVMSKQSVEVDATFGAILKRSLSLRPR